MLSQARGIGLASFYSDPQELAEANPHGTVGHGISTKRGRECALPMSRGLVTVTTNCPVPGLQRQNRPVCWAVNCLWILVFFFSCALCCKIAAGENLNRWLLF